MIYDFCEIEYHLPHKVSGKFGLFEYTGYNYPKGYLFKSKAFNELNLYWNDRTNWLTISGSPAFYFQGHNFKFDANELQKGFDFLSSVVGFNLFNAFVTTFEAGVLLTTTYKPQAIFTTHTYIKGMKSKSFESGIWFEDRIKRVKLYDAGKRMKKIIDKGTRNQLQTDFGYQHDTNYIRLEIHYKKPENCFKHRVTLKDLVSEGFQNIVKSDIIQTYQSIDKTPSFVIPNSLKKPSVSNILLMLLKQDEITNGEPLKEKYHALLRTLTNLTKEDIKFRKRKFRSDLDKITVEHCLYDMGEQLCQILKE